MASGHDTGAFGGYDATFVKPLEKELECPMCHLAMRNPVQTPCGQEFCKSCFSQVARSEQLLHLIATVPYALSRPDL